MFDGIAYWKPRNHCCMKGVVILGLTEKRNGVFGSISEFAGNPCCTELNPGIEQSICPGLGFAEFVKQGWLNDCVTKNGGLHAGLGLEYGPVFCAPLKNS